MRKLVGVKAKTYADLMVVDSGHKKAKGTKKCELWLWLRIIKIVCLITK